MKLPNVTMKDTRLVLINPVILRFLQNFPVRMTPASKNFHITIRCLEKMLSKRLLYKDF